jgi:hypothetical protein
MTDLFKDIIPAILLTKKNVIENDEKSYVPFIVNRALSFHYDCVLFANEMNMHHTLDKKMQFQYLLNSIRSYKRPFSKWLKHETVENLECVKEYYGYSNEKAKDALRVLSNDQINEIKTRLKKGGLKNDKSQRINRGDSV